MRLVGLSSLFLTCTAQTTTQFATSPTPKTQRVQQTQFAPQTFTPFQPASSSAQSFTPQTFSSQTFTPQTFNGQTFSPQTFNGQAFNTPAFNAQPFNAQTSPAQTAAAPQSFAPQQSFSSSGGSVGWQVLFDPNQFRSYNMDITPTNVALMNQDPKKEVKVPCTVTTDYMTPQARTYSSPNIGCGYKGSVGALRICFDAYGKFSPDDCRKASYKIDANYFNKNGNDEIGGVHRLMFHGAPADWSMVGERLAYSLLHGWGIIAPTATHASLYQNGKFLGVFVFVSPIDDIFTQKYFASDNNQGRGALYKEAWFNPVHMADVASTHYAGKNEDAFMRQIEDAVMSTPLDKQSATQFFNTYFDVNSLVDVTAANTVLGNTDDWRQRHNLYWYIREDASGKKAVLIPWDYDRLNDAGAGERGALKGRAWWDANTRTNCNNPLRSAAARGQIKGGSDPMQVSYWTDVFMNTPPDVEQPVSCDKIAQLMALALGTQIRQRTRELAATINRASMQADLQTWTSQIQSAIAKDPDGPRSSDMSNEQRLLLDAIVNSAQKAVTQANAGDSGISVPGPASATSSFVPKASASSSATGDFSGRYQVGQVISSTFTPVNPAFASMFSGKTTSGGGYVPKSTTQPAAYTPKATSSFSSSTPWQSSTTSSQFTPATSFSTSFSQSSAFKTPSTSFSQAGSFQGSFPVSLPSSYSPALPSSYSSALPWGR